jgi:hypothetical protein
MTVYLLWHAHDLDEEIDVKLLGVYSSEERAAAARAQAKTLPGFRENLAGFHIDGYEVDRDHWTSGFVTVYRGEPGVPDTQQGEGS